MENQNRSHHRIAVMTQVTDTTHEETQVLTFFRDHQFLQDVVYCNT